MAKPGAKLHVFCFSDLAPECVPVTVSKEDLHANLGPYWDITSIEPRGYVSAFTEESMRALAGSGAGEAFEITTDPDGYAKDAEGRLVLRSGSSRRGDGDAA